MALFGDFGKFFQAAVAPIIVPTKFAINVATKGPQAAITSARKDLSLYEAGGRMALAVIGVGGKQKQIDAPRTGPGFQQMQDQYGEQYFQPTQFSGGQYDPTLGGGFPGELEQGGFQSWDYSTFSTPADRTSWGGYSQTTEDWAAGW